MVDKNYFQSPLSDEQYGGLKYKLNAFITDNFNDQLKFSCCRILPVTILTVKETKIVRKAVKKRRYEFSAGRRCAKKCLEQYFISDFSLLKGRYGEPIWPRGFTGSITHDAEMVFAVAQPQENGYVGIDFADLPEQAPYPHLILNSGEINAIKYMKNPEFLLFCLKESVIKILSPILQDYIEFKDININLENSVAEVTYREKKTGINLFWLIHGNYIFTVATKNIT